MPARRCIVSLAVVAAAASPGACVGGAPPDVQELRAEFADAPIVVDGRADDAAWRTAHEVVVPLKGPAGPAEVHLRAAVHDGALHVLARWRDATEDRAHKVWTAGPDGSVVPGPEREDVFALAFPVSGPFVADMLAPVECVWDVWQWKAARTDPAGYAMDKSHVHSFTDPGGRRRAEPLGDGRTLYLRRPEDAGTSVTKSLAAPPPGGAPAPQFAAQVPSGSAADVRARGTWADGWWTLEISRTLRTGNPDDADLAGGADGTVPFAVAILDRGEDEDHASSEVCRLAIVR